MSGWGRLFRNFSDSPTTVELPKDAGLPLSYVAVLKSPREESMEQVPIWNFEQQYEGECGDETSVNLRAYFDPHG